MTTIKNNIQINEDIIDLCNIVKVLKYDMGMHERKIKDLELLFGSISVIRMHDEGMKNKLMTLESEIAILKQTNIDLCKDLVKANEYLYKAINSTTQENEIAELQELNNVGRKSIRALHKELDLVKDKLRKCSCYASSERCQ